MIAEFKGTLVSVKENYPDKSKRQDFAPNLSVSLLQTKPDGDVDLVKFKDEDLSRKYTLGEQVCLEVQIFHWSQGDRSGVSLKVIRVLSPSLKKAV